MEGYSGDFEGDVCGYEDEVDDSVDVYIVLKDCGDGWE